MKMVRLDIKRLGGTVSMVINTEYFVRAMNDGKAVLISFTEPKSDVAFGMATEQDARAAVDEIWRLVG